MTCKGTLKPLKELPNRKLQALRSTAAVVAVTITEMGGHDTGTMLDSSFSSAGHVRRNDRSSSPKYAAGAMDAEAAAKMAGRRPPAPA